MNNIVMPLKSISHGRVEIILGCMFSGKSTELIHRCGRYEAIGKNIQLVNHTFDTRTTDYVQTHNKHMKPAVKIDSLVAFMSTNEYKDAHIIGIDEAQFFTDLLEFVKLSETDKKIIVIAGLDGDFQRRPFGQILECIPYCDEVVKLTAFDMLSCDGTPAIFSKKISSGSDTIDVGYSDKYVAVSRENFNT